jgi:Tol biopolymer transport system component
VLLVTPALGIGGRLLDLLQGARRPLEVGSPLWSPDGRKIAFVGDRDGNAEVYVMNADGSGQRRLTHNGR